ncbi:MAG TPA: hypothetical protein VGE53_02280 [Candidatus Paceibacterota bacterium]
MNAKVIWIVLVLIGIIGIGWLAFGSRAGAPADTQTATTTEMTRGEEPAPIIDGEDGGPAFAVVTLTDSGFTPSTLTVNAGETVRFINESSRGMWVGSDDHPTHTDYDGTATREHCANGMATNGTFDQCASVNKGDYWDYTFERAGSFGYHNHVGASNTGTIVVR